MMKKREMRLLLVQIEFVDFISVLSAGRLPETVPRGQDCACLNGSILGQLGRAHLISRVEKNRASRS